MVNYANGQVYRLVNNVDEKYYIGSTCNSLHKRKNGHKRDAKNSLNNQFTSISTQFDGITLKSF